MTVTNIATAGHRFRRAQGFKNSLANTAHYVFAGDHIDHSNLELQQISSDMYDTMVAAYRNMLYGKIIANTDAAFLVRKIPWQSGTAFAMYDDQDQNIETKDFFVQVHEGSFYHFWKCLDNNNGANSTQQPTFAAGATLPLYQLSDGYRWRYLASIDNATYNKFVTSTHLPIVANASVIAANNAGAIDVILVENQGARYDNYVDGTFLNSQLHIGGFTNLYALGGNNVVTSNGFYTGCLIYLSGGTGQGQYRTVTDFVANSTGNIIVLDSDFTTPPTSGTTYEIRPTVQIQPVEAAPAVNCVARALVNSLSTNSIYRVEILQRGQGYVLANAAVIANAIVGVTNTAILRPINSPFGGHGNWTYQELFCNDVEVSVNFSNSEGNTIPTVEKFQQVGVLRDPLFANVNLQLTANQGTFTTGEQVFVITPRRINANVTMTAGSSNVTCAAAAWSNEVMVGDYLYITDGSGALNQLAIVNSVTNSSQITLTTTGFFSCTQSTIYSANVSSNAYVLSVSSSNNIFVTNCQASFTSPNKIIGFTSGAIGNINTINRNDVAKAFNTFVDLHKYSATLLAGSFTNDEVLTQGNTSAYFHSLTGANTSTLLVSNFTGLPFDLGQVIGNTSLAIASISKVYGRELVDDTGEVLYIENINPVTRQNNQTETIQIVFNF